MRFANLCKLFLRTKATYFELYLRGVALVVRLRLGGREWAAVGPDIVLHVFHILTDLDRLHILLG